MVANQQFLNAINNGQVLQTLMTALQNPQSFAQGFISAMNQAAAGQQLNTGPLNMPTTPVPSSVLPNVPIVSAADASIQYSNMEAARDASAAQNFDDAMNNAGDAWSNFWKGDFSAAKGNLSDAFDDAVDAVGDQVKAFEYSEKANEYADLAGQQVSATGQVVGLISPQLANVVSGAGAGVAQQLKDYNTALDNQQSTFLGRVI